MNCRTREAIDHFRPLEYDPEPADSNSDWVLTDDSYQAADSANQTIEAFPVTTRSALNVQKDMIQVDDSLELTEHDAPP